MTSNGQFTIGEVAGMLGVTRRRVDEWVRDGVLQAVRTGAGPGRYKLVPLTEIELARRVLRFARRHGFGGQVPRGLFDHMRARGDQ